MCIYRYSAYIMWDRVHPGWTGSLIIARALMKELEKSKSTAKTSMNV